MHFNRITSSDGQRMLHVIERFALVIVLGTTIIACGNDGTGEGAEEGDTATVLPRRETIDTPAVPLNDSASGAAAGVTTPEPEARKQMQEKFDTMGGMEGVRITFEGPNAVVLEGTVKTADRKQTAEDVARAVPGITTVTNRIQVGG